MRQDLKQLSKDGSKIQIFLFIGCSDSRVTPELVLDTKPGDMFTLRNVGNFVPPYNPDNDYHGSSSGYWICSLCFRCKTYYCLWSLSCGACKKSLSRFRDSPDFNKY